MRALSSSSRTGSSLWSTRASATTSRSTFGPILESEGKALSDVTLIIDSHDHFDHAQANPALKAASGAKVAAHESAADSVPGGVDIKLHDGDPVDVGSFHFRVVHLPGHSETCIGLYEPSVKVLILGTRCRATGESIKVM